MSRPSRLLATALTSLAVAGAGTGVAVHAALRADRLPSADRIAVSTPAQPGAPVAASTAGAATAGAAGAENAVVRPLHRLSTPDVWVQVDRPLTATQTTALRRIRGLRALAVLDVGTVVLRGHRLPAVGVDPSVVRGLTPVFTARSDALWASVARGELTVSYARSDLLGHDLGAWLPARLVGSGAAAAAARPTVRVGAFAALGLGRAQVLVARTMSAPLGLSRSRVAVLAAPGRSTPALVTAVRRVVGEHAVVRVLRPAAVRRAPVTAYARALIPAGYLALYQRAATTCRGLSWTVLAAIGTVESRNGADTGPSSKGALGPMQFLPTTWAAYGVDANGDGRADINDPQDAVYSAARYLCAWGAGLGGQSLVDAVWAYNHADWYVRQVLTLAAALG